MRHVYSVVWLPQVDMCLPSTHTRTLLHYNRDHTYGLNFFRGKAKSFVFDNRLEVHYKRISTRIDVLSHPLIALETEC